MPVFSAPSNDGARSGHRVSGIAIVLDVIGKGRSAVFVAAQAGFSTSRGTRSSSASCNASADPPGRMMKPSMAPAPAYCPICPAASSVVPMTHQCAEPITSGRVRSSAWAWLRKIDAAGGDHGLLAPERRRDHTGGKAPSAPSGGKCSPAILPICRRTFIAPTI